MLGHCGSQRVERGDYVCQEGESGDRVWFLESGHALVEATTRQGDVSTVAVRGPGDVFGEQALIAANYRRSNTIVALEALELLYLSRREFNRLRAAHPSVDQFLFAVMAARLHEVTSQLLEALYGTAEQRVYARLQHLAVLYAGAAGRARRIPLTQERMASLAGTTRPTANRVLRSAAKAGAIGLGRGYLVIEDRVLLDALAASVT